MTNTARSVYDYTKFKKVHTVFVQSFKQLLRTKNLLDIIPSLRDDAELLDRMAVETAAVPGQYVAPDANIRNSDSRISSKEKIKGGKSAGCKVETSSVATTKGIGDSSGNVGLGKALSDVSSTKTAVASIRSMNTPAPSCTEVYQQIANEANSTSKCSGEQSSCSGNTIIKDEHREIDASESSSCAGHKSVTSVITSECMKKSTSVGVKKPSCKSPSDNSTTLASSQSSASVPVAGSSLVAGTLPPNRLSTLVACP